jgi:hypothetical protein
MTKKELKEYAENCKWKMGVNVDKLSDGAIYYIDPNGQKWYGTYDSLRLRLAEWIKRQADIYINIHLMASRLNGMPRVSVVYQELLDLALLLAAATIEPECPVCGDIGGSGTLGAWCNKCRSWRLEPHCFRCGRRQQSFKRCNCKE